MIRSGTTKSFENFQSFISRLKPCCTGPTRLLWRVQFPPEGLKSFQGGIVNGPDKPPPDPWTEGCTDELSD